MIRLCVEKFCFKNRSMREVIDLLSSDSSDLMMLFDDDPTSLETSSMKGSYSAVRQDSLSTTGSVEAYTYDFERLFSIKGKLHNISFSFYHIFMQT